MHTRHTQHTHVYVCVSRFTGLPVHSTPGLCLLPHRTPRHLRSGRPPQPRQSG